MSGEVPKLVKSDCSDNYLIEGLYSQSPRGPIAAVSLDANAAADVEKRAKKEGISPAERALKDVIEDHFEEVTL